MPGRLSHKSAIITGAGTGIGEAIAHKFVREGANVIVAGLPGDPVEEVAQVLRAQRGQAHAFIGDLAREMDAQRCVAAAIQHFGKLDILINNAGVFTITGETQDVPIEEYDREVNNNCRTVFLMTKFALPHLHKTRGNIVSTGSEAGAIGIAMNTPYGGCKAFIHAFMRGVAVEQAKHGVRANCVCPGPVDTAWTHKETGPMNAQMEKLTVASTAMGRRGTVEEIANVFAFVASDEASYMTGSLVFVDGGVTIAKGSVGEQVPKDLREQPAVTLEVKHTHEGTKNIATQQV